MATCAHCFRHCCQAVKVHCLFFCIRSPLHNSHKLVQKFRLTNKSVSNYVATSEFVNPFRQILCQSSSIFVVKVVEVAEVVEIVEVVEVVVVVVLVSKELQLKLNSTGRLRLPRYVHL